MPPPSAYSIVRRFHSTVLIAAATYLVYISAPDVCYAENYQSQATASVTDSYTCGAFWKYCKEEIGLRKYFFPLISASISEAQIVSVAAGAIITPAFDEFAVGPVFEIEPGIAGGKAGLGLGAQYYMPGHTPLVAGFRLKATLYRSWLEVDGGPFGSPSPTTFKGLDLTWSVLILRFSALYIEGRDGQANWLGSMGVGL